MTYHGADPSRFEGETMRLKIRASMTILWMTILCLTALGLTARGAGAQFLQYTPPGGPEVSPESRQE
jgi:hypothetical protein